ncbi:MAG: substrate-binding domain-containing protein [Gammaproteobacteria bacterium]
MRHFLLLIVLLSASFDSPLAEQQRLRVATTTSTENSGLLDKLNPLFEKMHGIKVDVIAVATGKAIRLARNGDVDLILVHAPDAEIKFVEDGYGIERLPVMYNDFVIIGPKKDPAGIRNSKNISEVMLKLEEARHTFISRGDDSGTHKKEANLWQAVETLPKGRWYLSVGQGMGQTIVIANEKEAYALSDRGTYLAYKHKVELDIIFENSGELINPYHIILVSPKKYPHAKISLARKYSMFLRSKAGKNIIKNFKVDNQTLFYPN